VDWKYHIIHEWSEERCQWAELLLLPDDAIYKGEALWVTIDCLGSFDPENEVDKEDKEWYYKALQKLADQDYWVREEGSDFPCDSDMIIKAKNFTRDEFLYWVSIWIKEKALPITELVAAPIEDFVGIHSQADLIKKKKKVYKT